ncbi:MAG: hypothetical protein ACREIO_04915 [Nitrospiraceae bacterium]
MTPRADFDPSRAAALGHRWLAEGARLVIVPVVLFGSGFFTADFLVSGQYTWPRSSRIVGLTLTILVLSYEFVYKEQRARHSGRAGDHPLRALLYSCAIPYVVGALALLGLARLAS